MRRIQSLSAGQVQFFLVVAFIVGAFLMSFLLKTIYEPPGKVQRQERVLVVQTERIAPAPHRITFSATGVVQARNEVTIVPEVNGRVIAVDDAIFAGGVFTKNTPLFTIDPRDFKLAIQRQRAEVARAKTVLSLEQAESEAALAEWQQLHGKVRKVPSLVARVPQLAEARANVESAQAQLIDAQLDLERSEFRLPFDGRVLESNVSVGQYVMAGQQYGRVFDKTMLEVTSSLQDEQLKWLLNASEPDIIIHTNYLGKARSYPGTLKRGAAALDSGTRFAAVRFGFERAEDTILPGIFATVDVAGETVDQVMLLPSSAMQAGGVAWLLEEGLLVSWQPNVIYTAQDYIAVEGLPEPVTLVMNRLAGATEGMRVSVEGAVASGDDTASDNEAGEDVLNDQ